jgi:hypothetical protein
MIDTDNNLNSPFVNSSQSIENKKYLFERYCINNNRNYNAKNNLIQISSIITLTEPFVKFSKVNLPNTNILDRSILSLNFINYWKIFNEKRKIQNIIVDDFNESDNFTSNSYLSSIKKYSYMKVENLDNDKSISNKNNKKTMSITPYSNFLNKIIPEIKTLFNIVKKNINGKLSLVSVLDYLEPFLIYSFDIGYVQYKEINRFINEKIKKYINDYYKKNIEFSKIKRFNFDNNFKKINIIYELIKYNDDLREKIFSNYEYINSENLSNSELLKMIILKDYGRLYNTTTSLENLALMISSNLDEVFRKDLGKTKKEIEKEDKDKKKNKCINYTVSKLYTSLKELQNDNYKEILYFDKKYDKTDYSILDKYRQQQNMLEADEFLLYLSNQLSKKYKYNEEKAIEEAETLILGSKKIKDGDYAIFYDEVNSFFYVRENNIWVLDNSVNDKNSIDVFGLNPEELLCNLQKDCIFKQDILNNECQSISLNKDELKNNVIKKILDEFNDKYFISKEELKNKITKELKYNYDIFNKLNEIKTLLSLKNNLQKYKIGMETMIETPDIVSPYSKILSIILGNNDIVKKNNDILLFCNNFTREAIPQKIDIISKDYENIHWRYCNKTDVKLIPKFFMTLASTFIEDNKNYEKVLDKIVKEIGTISDDGDFWVDKYSGYKIKDSDFDTEEDYNKEGFKLKTRDILEEDFTSDNIIKGEDLKTLIQNPLNKIIINIVNTITTNMGINIDTQLDFILYNVKNLFKIIVPYTKEEYTTIEQEASKKGKKIKNYKDVVNTTIMYLSLSMILISIQVNIPSIKTKKTFPNCIRSFEGYPVYNNTDFTGLEYLSCVAFNSRSSQEPWNVLQKQKQENISKGIKQFIDEYFIKNNENPTLQRKINEKIDYNNYIISNKIQEIPVIHDVNLWTNFLPPLIMFELSKIPENINNEFKLSLTNDIKNGLYKQNNKIDIIKTKIESFSLYIQQLIQIIINTKKLILKNSVNEPFMDNQCCNDIKTNTVIEYFILENNEIQNNINTVIKLANIFKDINKLSKSTLIYCANNDKIKYPSINPDFSENIIYQSFIVFCNFNSLIPIPNSLLGLCDKKPEDFNKNDSIENQIIFLKKQGFEYNNNLLLKLLQINGRKNIISYGINSEKERITVIDNLKNFIFKINELKKQNKENKIISKNIYVLLNKLIPKYEIYKNKDSDELRNIYDYLLEKNEQLKEKIKKNIKYSVKKKSEQNKINYFIDNFNNWDFNKDNHNNQFKIYDEEQYNSNNFVKEYIVNIIKVFPKIILNKVSYNDLIIQKYLKLSKSHEDSIKKFVNDYYEPLYKFYYDKTIENVLKYINNNLDIIVELMNIIPNMSMFEDDSLYNNFNKKTIYLLNEYFFFYTLSYYIDLTKQDSMVVNEDDALLYGLKENDENIRERQQYEGEEETKGQDVLTKEYLDDTYKKDNINPFIQNTEIVEGNKLKLNNKISSLIVSYINIMLLHKNSINKNYTNIMNSVFKEKMIEKNNITDRLSSLNIEERKVNTTLKINKLGEWGKGLNKGLVIYDKDVYEDEIEEMKQIMNIETQIRETQKINESDMNNKDLNDFMNEEQNIENEDDELNNLSRFGEDFFNQYDGEELDQDDLDSYN